MKSKEPEDPWELVNSETCWGCKKKGKDICLDCSYKRVRSVYFRRCGLKHLNKVRKSIYYAMMPIITITNSD